MATINIDITKLAGENFEDLFLKAGNDKGLYDSLIFENPTTLNDGSGFNTQIVGNLKTDSPLYPVAKIKTFTFRYNRVLPFPSNLDSEIAVFDVAPTVEELELMVRRYPMIFSNVTIVVGPIPTKTTEVVTGEISIMSNVSSLVYASTSVITYRITAEEESPVEGLELTGFTNNALFVRKDINGFTNDDYMAPDT